MAWGTPTYRTSSVLLTGLSAVSPLPDTIWRGRFSWLKWTRPWTWAIFWTQLTIQLQVVDYWPSRWALSVHPWLIISVLKGQWLSCPKLTDLMIHTFSHLLYGLLYTWRQFIVVWIFECSLKWQNTTPSAIWPLQSHLSKLCFVFVFPWPNQVMLAGVSQTWSALLQILSFSYLLTSLSKVSFNRSRSSKSHRYTNHNALLPVVFDLKTHLLFLAPLPPVANNSELVECLEALLLSWVQQIELVLTESEQMRKEADDIGPAAELEYWKSRMTTFNRCLASPAILIQ